MLKAVIFDVGGVLIRTHSRAGREKWAEKLGMDAWEFEGFIFGGESGRATQLGQKTEPEHWRWLGEHFGLDETSLSEMHRDFFAGDAMNEPLVAYIDRLRQSQKYRLGILSNFGDAARTLWSETFPFIHLFEEVIISSEVGVMKPNPKIYHIALERVGVAPEEAVFIDDFIENVEGARAVGMQAIHFKEPEAVQKALVELTGIE